MPLDLFNDALDDAPALAESVGFTGVDTLTKPDVLPDTVLRDGLNLWMDGSGIAVERPGLRLVDFLDTGGALAVGDTRVQGVGYYDTPTIEALLAVRNGKLYTIDSADAGAAFSALAPTPSATATVRFAQLVDRMFWTDGTLRWSYYTGSWAHGTVTTFSTTAAMPPWALITAHNFRLLAVENKGYRLYASAIGQAHNPADWVPTENIRVGTGDGDPIKAVLPGQGSTLLVLCQNSAWQVDTTEATLANWTVRKITDNTGCVEGRTAVAIGQDVLFLSRYGVTSLGALADQISLSPATSLSAPMQAYIDRINWNTIGTAHATLWRDLYLLALPLDDDTQATTILPFNVRTQQWMTPWQIGAQGIVTGTTSGAALLVDEVADFLVDETGAMLLDSGASTPTLDAIDYTGLTAACTSRFDGRQETIIGDSTGRLFRLDETTERDDTDPSGSQPIESWLLTKSYNYGLPQHNKQPHLLETAYERATANDVRLAIIRDGDLCYPEVELDEVATVATDLTVGNLTSFPLVFPILFKPNKVFNVSLHIRDQPRFKSASVFVHSLNGRLRMRSTRLAAFIDTPTLQ